MTGRDLLGAALVGTVGVVILFAFVYRTPWPVVVWLVGYVVTIAWEPRT